MDWLWRFPDAIAEYHSSISQPGMLHLKTKASLGGKIIFADQAENSLISNGNSSK